ncbi:MAG: electron transfer flavoprotein subunit beta/FixA family protein [Bacillota bacterium]
MEIIVCIKQVPDPEHLQLDPHTGTIIREGVPTIINAADKHALELALQLRQKNGGRVTAISMGPPSAAEALKEALAMGADMAALASDRAFAGADTLATSATLVALIHKLKPFDLVICGYSSLDSGTAQVGPQVAAILRIPFFTAVQKADKSADIFQVEVVMEDGNLVYETTLPALLTVGRRINRPRGIRLSEAKKARSKELLTFDLQSLGLTPDTVGGKGSKLSMVEKIPLSVGKGAEMIIGEPEEISGVIYGKIRNIGLGIQGGI